MRVSIITVCYNSEETIKDTIESVLSQNHDDVEYIIVDGGSTDGTLDIIYRYRDSIDKVVSESDGGIYDAMNKGIEMATGDVIGILNSDDIYSSPSVLTLVSQEFINDNELKLVYGSLVLCEASDLSRVRRFYNCSNFKPWKLRYGWMPAHPASFFKAEVYKLYGNYSKQYHISSDYEFFVRTVFLNKIKIKYVDKVLVNMRLGGVSTGGLRSFLLINKEIVAACRANGIYTNLFLVLAKIPFKILELYKRPRDKA